MHEGKNICQDDPVKEGENISEEAYHKLIDRSGQCEFGSKWGYTHPDKRANELNNTLEGEEDSGGDVNQAQVDLNLSEGQNSCDCGLEDGAKVR